MRDVAYISHVPEVEGGAEDVRGFVFGDAGVNGRDELVVTGAGENGGAENAG